MNEKDYDFAGLVKNAKKSEKKSNIGIYLKTGMIDFIYLLKIYPL